MFRRSHRFAFVAAIVFLAAPVTAQVGPSVTVVEANTATEAQLRAVPHLTPALVQAIVNARPLASALSLDSLLAPTLSAEQRREVYGRLWIHLNLNTASREEILLIPGMGPRMLREFLEYRPYRAMAQFRREMGKYVDEAEVARLAQYVFVPMDLNSASDEDLLTIPGLGSRMLREFKEYRPYRGIEQFRREIGKYVDADEVARLERFVILP